ncbi:MAG: VOC family protein [Atopobiaceae bacterium]|jgi:2-dehydro-3-deoxyphosphogluconate aldolase/(4S)-4-hydroxy-2-oxoglutarate aldolase|nr:VOC family protein [Atopobiaceae bacterium]MCH4180024.1 VOC family protein [Atopobiaceae bacterium]MCH4213924.1 VOC family protein [Atopobiaceae bacterium]MCH4229826.1 VOC family protein [Atopobiaceae bacterium]MCH4275613.1 VOC family protein [Atopobiaceae bacterium]
MSVSDPVADLGLRIAHIGINAASDAEAEAVAAKFQALMGLPRNAVAPISVFSGTLVETMKGCGRGEKGHIGFHVDDIPAAEEYFSGRGFEVDEASRKLNPDGTTFLVYFKEQVGGFAIHLTQG